MLVIASRVLGALVDACFAVAALVVALPAFALLDFALFDFDVLAMALLPFASLAFAALVMVALASCTFPCFPLLPLSSVSTLLSSFGVEWLPSSR